MWNLGKLQPFPAGFSLPHGQSGKLPSLYPSRFDLGTEQRLQLFARNQVDALDVRKI
jgi:hypothetical protein